MSNMRWTQIAAATIAGVALLIPTLGNAHLVNHRDADDAEQKLDIMGASIDRSDGQLTFTMSTYDRFTRKDLVGSGFVVFIDSGGDGGFDFRVDLGLYEDLYPYCAAYDQKGFSRAGAEAKIGRRYITCSFDRNVFKPAKHIRWRTKSVAYDNLVDRAPDRGWFRH